MKKVKVFIVDDHSIFRKGLALQLGELGFVDLVGEAENGELFLDTLDSISPDVVFMDIKMPGMGGIETTKLAIQKKKSIRIIALSMFGEEEYLQNMLDAGAKGFLLKNIEKNDLQKAIYAVMDGNNYFSEELITILTNKFLNKAPKVEDTEDIVKLTNRELEVLQLICKGMTNQEIAEKLFLSQRTVDGHRANLLSKVGAKNTVGLVTYAIKNKLVEI